MWLGGDVSDGAGQTRDGHVCGSHVCWLRVDGGLEELLRFVVPVWVLKEVPLVDRRGFLLSQNLASIQLQKKKK